jgi:ubiquinone/menaquinone biosynthesis C-methylase UbiE
MSRAHPSDLHVGFRDPAQAVPAALTTFLEQADQLPGIQAIQRAIRRALRPWPGARLLDAGCGIGLETTRIAFDYPHTHVTGLDRNADLLAAAQRRAGVDRPNLTWVHADLAVPDLPDASFDLIRTERVLMYAAGASFDQAVGALLRQLRPGGRLALFELDYGAMILAPGPGRDHDRATRELTSVLERSLPQPWAGRRLPAMLAERGAIEVTAHPYSFALSEPVWRKIVLETLHTAAEEGRLSPDAARQLEAQAEHAASSPFLAAACGILVTARKRTV